MRRAEIVSTDAMIALMGLLARAHSPAISQVELDPVLWWNAARASGLMAWMLLSASVTVGLLKDALLTRGSARRWTLRYHEFVGALAVMFTIIHMVSVFSTGQLRVGVAQLLVPFTKPDSPAAQGCGVIACYLLAGVIVTSCLRAVLPWRWWRRVHLLSLPLWGLATAHTVLAGSDITDPVLWGAGVAVAGVVVFLVILRLTNSWRAGAGTAPGAGPVGEPAATGSGPQSSWSGACPAVTTLVSAGMRLIITQTTWEAEHVLSLRLASVDGAALPSWEPGAHIELVLPSGRCRQYSLCGDPDDNRTYRIAVLQLPAGRGGSVELHTIARAGQLITGHGPRNHFPLVASPAYLFIAGGIGITAIMAMAARVASAGCEWKLIYSGRRRANMAFVEEVRALGADRVQVLPGDECSRPDLPAIIEATPPGVAIYCCGPDRMLQAVREQALIRDDLSLHRERFTGTAADGAAFQVELQRSRHLIDVPTNRTVLQAVRDVVPAISVGCQQGICGACRTTILAGEPDHRDELLSNAERAAGAMLICVSRARTEKLTLDL